MAKLIVFLVLIGCLFGRRECMISSSPTIATGDFVTIPSLMVEKLLYHDVIGIVERIEADSLKVLALLDTLEFKIFDLEINYIRPVKWNEPAKLSTEELNNRKKGGEQMTHYIPKPLTEEDRDFLRKYTLLLNDLTFNLADPTDMMEDLAINYRCKLFGGYINRNHGCHEMIIVCTQYKELRPKEWENLHKLWVGISIWSERIVIQ